MKVLLLSPHTDDVELGAGGTVAKLLEEGHELYWVVFSTCEDAVPKGLPRDTLKKEFLSVVNYMGIKNYETHNFKNKEFPSHRQEILETLVNVKKKI
ncbi:MAG TPA: PIG-L family deacetylase, partial [Candidatus Aenigmarchaeota archaeon]|nr:PIG-L family deacetylase [Candidatus Aenigmarchaeota archaeon]